MFQFPGCPAASDILTFIHHHHQHMALGIASLPLQPRGRSVVPSYIYILLGYVI